MVLYRIIQESTTFGDLSGEATELNQAIKMAKQYSKKRRGATFIVEKVERVWPTKQAHDNAIHASIHASDLDIGRAKS
jgi:hypothetical protein